MKRSLFVTFALYVVAGRLVAAPTPDDDRAKAVATLDKALKALGGEDKLTRLTSFIVKSRGKSFHSDGNVSEHVTTHSYQFPDHRRIEVKNDKDEIVWTQVLAGDRGWNVSGGMGEEMAKKDLAQSKEYYFLQFGVRDLPSFKGMGYKLAWLGEFKVEKQAAEGIRVSHVVAPTSLTFFIKTRGFSSSANPCY